MAKRTWLRWTRESAHWSMMGITRWQRQLGVGVALLVMLAGVGIAWHSTVGAVRAMAITESMSSAGNALPYQADQEISGHPDAPARLQALQTRLNAAWTRLDQGGAWGLQEALPTPDEKVRQRLTEVAAILNDMALSVTGLLQNDQAIVASSVQKQQVAEALKQAVDPLNVLASSALPSPWSSNVSEWRAAFGQPAVQNGDVWMNDDPSTGPLQTALSAWMDQHAQAANGLASAIAQSGGNDVTRQQALTLAAAWTSAHQALEAWRSGAGARQEGRKDREQLSAQDDRLQQALRGLALAQQEARSEWGWWVACGGFLACLIVLAWPSATSVKTVAVPMDEGARELAQAVDRLTQDLSQVVDRKGSMHLERRLDSSFIVTRKVTTTINQLIEALWNVSQEVGVGVRNVDESTQDAQQCVTQMAKTVRVQRDSLTEVGKMIESGSQRVKDLAQRLDGVSSLSHQATQSVQAGHDVLQSTIVRMNSLRDNMQDTSKRIKRFGESSQGIGEATETIRNTAKQVLVLAMNASIEAAAAGDAGREFASVASEIQRLAKNTSASVQTIDDLVTMIQDDAKNTVMAMESSTAEVVEGARLTDRAGMTLDDLVGLIQQLERDVKAVLDDLEHQVQQTHHVASTLQDVQDVTAKGEQETMVVEDVMERVREIVKSLKQTWETLTPAR